MLFSHYFSYLGFNIAYADSSDCWRTWPEGEDSYICASSGQRFCENSGSCGSWGEYCVRDGRCQLVLRMLVMGGLVVEPVLGPVGMTLYPGGGGPPVVVSCSGTGSSWCADGASCGEAAARCAKWVRGRVVGLVRLVGLFLVPTRWWFYQGYCRQPSCGADGKITSQDGHVIPMLTGHRWMCLYTKMERRGLEVRS